MTALGALVEEGLVRTDVPLGPLTTYKFGGNARHFAELERTEEILRLAAALREEPGSFLVLGRGSNIVVSDTGFPGIVLRLGRGFTWSEISTEGSVSAGAAASLPLLAWEAARAGRGGLEFFVGVPGSVGGGVRMNAGCHGSEMVDWLVEATVVDMTRAAVSVRSPRDLEMGYRYTNLQPTEVVAEATFSSKPRRREEAEQEIREITRWRRRHQPGGTLNAGSVFKNPPGDAAGRIIDELGLKGFRVGGAAVSEKHANFFVADPGASSQEVYDLVWAVRRKVGEATGIWLEPEVRFVGEFRPSGDEGR